MIHARNFAALALLPALLVACGEEDAGGPPLNQGSVRMAFEEASLAEGVPVDLLLAIGWYETHWTHAQPELEHEESEGGEEEGGHHHLARYGIMQLSDQSENDTLPLAAQLTGQSIETLKTDLGWNIRGAAAVLRRYADEMYEGQDIESLSLFNWLDVVAFYYYRDEGDDAMDMAYMMAEEVFAVLREGAGRTLDSGEHLELFSNPGLGQPDESEFGQLSGPVTGMAGVKWSSAHTSNFGNRTSGVKPTHIIIHTTQGRYAGAISWFKNPKAKASAHYVIRSSDGEITQMVDEVKNAWHAKTWNSKSIGIEHEGFINDRSWYTEAMYRSSARLTCDIARRWNIPTTRTYILGHVELSGNNHTDPGPHWDWNYYMGLVRECSGGGGGGTTTPTPPAHNGGGTTTNPGKGTLQGIVYANGNTNSRISGASVRLSNGQTLTADSSGYWKASVAPGNYTVTVSKTGYSSASVSRTVVKNGDTWASASLTSTSTTTNTGRISGIVYNSANTASRISGATVRVGNTSVSTDANGRYDLSAPVGTQSVSVSANGYASKTVNASVSKGINTTLNVALSATSTQSPTNGTVSGRIYDLATNAGISGAQVTLTSGSTTLTATTNSSGQYSVRTVPSGGWRVTASAANYGSGSVSVTLGSSATGNVGLRKLAAGSGTGKLTGIVYESPSTTKRLAGATVTLSNGVSVTANSNGVYEVPVSGTVTAVGSHPGYSPRAVTRTVGAGSTIWGSIGLVKGGSGSGSTGAACTPTATPTPHYPPYSVELVSPLEYARTTLTPTFVFKGVGDATARYRVVIVRADTMNSPTVEYEAGKANNANEVRYTLTRALQPDIYIWSAYAVWDDCATTPAVSWGFFSAQN